MDIKAKIESLSIGDKIRINDWTECFDVCGVSENFVLAHHGDEEYTIISKKPVDYCYNDIPVGSFVCAPDNYIFGFGYSYRYDDPEWVKSYLENLETGLLEMSIKRREHIVYLEVFGGQL